MEILRENDDAITFSKEDSVFKATKDLKVISKILKGHHLLSEAVDVPRIKSVGYSRGNYFVEFEKIIGTTPTPAELAIALAKIHSIKGREKETRVDYKTEGIDPMLLKRHEQLISEKARHAPDAKLIIDGISVMLKDVRIKEIENKNPKASLIHGNFHQGNAIKADKTYVLDFESVRFGDPRVDLDSAFEMICLKDERAFFNFLKGYKKTFMGWPEN